MASDPGKYNNKLLHILPKLTDEKSKKAVFMQMQKQVEGQSVQVQLSHEGSKQMHTQVSQVASSNTTVMPTSTMVMSTPQQIKLSQQGMQKLENVSITDPIHTQGGLTTVTTMDSGALQQIADWPSNERPQVIQPFLQNPTYIQPVYNSQGQFIVPQIIALHPAIIHQPIRVIASGKAFQAQMPHMLTTVQGKQIVQGPTTSFSGYATIPSSGSNQPFVLSQLGVLGQTNLLSATAQQQEKQQQRAVPQGMMQAMQFTPWQATFGPAGLPMAPGALQSSPFIAQGSQIFIRNPQYESAGMFIHNAQASSIEPHNKIPGQQMDKTNKPAEMSRDVKSKFEKNKTVPAILKRKVIKPGCNASTQTEQTQAFLQQTNFKSQKFETTVQTKKAYQNSLKTSPKKKDAAIQTKCSGMLQNLQPKVIVSTIVQQGTPNFFSLSPQDKLIKQVQTQSQQPPSQVTQQTQAQQPLIQIQHMQNVFQQQLNQKNQILMSNETQTEDRATFPMTPVTENVIFETLPGIVNMTSELPVTPDQTVQDVPVAQQILQAPYTASLPTSAKQDDPEQKENQENDQENGEPQTPGKPLDENTSSSEESMSSTSDSESEKNEALETEGDAQLKDKSAENKKIEKKITDKDMSSTEPPKTTMTVKPQILTHVIEGFVIQESSVPFPTYRGCMNGSMKRKAAEDIPENNKKLVINTNEDSKNKELATCKTCGKGYFESKFNISESFCSTNCAEREDENTTESESESESSLSPAEEQIPVENNFDNTMRINPLQWKVEDVCEFIRSIPDCANYVENFAKEEIDGEALMLIRLDHLIFVMSIDLDSAVKILDKIDTIRVNPLQPNLQY